MFVRLRLAFFFMAVADRASLLSAQWVFGLFARSNSQYRSGKVTFFRIQELTSNPLEYAHSLYDNVHFRDIPVSVKLKLKVTARPMKKTGEKLELYMSVYLCDVC